jgi:hypothetical protein
MSSTSCSDLLFLFELHERISELQADLTKVMNDPCGTSSERDALIGSIVELKMAVMEHTRSMRRKRTRAAAEAQAS